MAGSGMSLRDISDVAIDINTVVDESVVTFDSGLKKFVARPIGGGGAAVSDAVLKAWAEGGCYELTSITYHATYPTTIDTAVAKWPDGSAGVLTITARNTTFLKETAYTLTHADSGKTVTQAAVTLDANGNITTKPALTVA